MSLSAILIAGATGLVALKRSLTDGPRVRSARETTTPAKTDSVMAYGSLATPLKAGIKVQCILTPRLAPTDRPGAAANVQRFRRDGVIVELQPTRRRCGYQDVSVVIADPDLPFSPALGWVVEKIA